MDILENKIYSMPINGPGNQEAYWYRFNLLIRLIALAKLHPNRHYSGKLFIPFLYQSDTMRELDGPELYQALDYAKSLDAEEVSEIIERFQLDQAALSQAVFNIFPAVLAEQNEDMSHLFLTLCFDVLCVFQKAFGPLPSQEGMDFDWLEKQAMLLEAELQSLIKERDMDEKIRARLQDRFLQRSAQGSPQPGLVRYLNQATEDFAKESPGRAPAIRVTQTMIFIVVQLFTNLYSHTPKR